MSPGVSRRAMRVGIDLVRLSEIERSLARFGGRFVSRVFTPGEAGDCQRHSALASARFATRLAAKEAVFKILRPGREDALPWSSVEVRTAEGGHVEVNLSGNARVLAERRGLGAWALSLSHEGDYATAVAMAEVAAPEESNA